jgi:hypothetical protein
MRCAKAGWRVSARSTPDESSIHRGLNQTRNIARSFHSRWDFPSNAAGRPIEATVYPIMT